MPSNKNANKKSNSAKKVSVVINAGRPVQQRKQSSASKKAVPKAARSSLKAAYRGAIAQTRTLAERAEDRFVLGLYEPQIESRGPSSIPFNTFTTTHRVNAVVTNIRANAAAVYTDQVQMAVGLFPRYNVTGTNVGITDLSQAVPESFQALMVAKVDTTAGAWIGNINAVAGTSYPHPATATFANDGHTENAYSYDPNWEWDTQPVLSATGSGTANSRFMPSRITGIKVTLEVVSNVLNLQGSLRGGDNGTIYMSARLLAAAAEDNVSTAHPLAGIATADVFAPNWRDQEGGWTVFAFDPRKVELGSLQRGKTYEFVWVPTSDSQLSYVDNIAVGYGGFAQSLSATTTPNKNLNFSESLRRGPQVQIHISGLPNAEIAFRVRATMAMEHVVTPASFGALYDYSRKSQNFTLPWDVMAQLPVAAVGHGSALVSAGALLEMHDAEARAYGISSTRPSMVRSIAGVNGMAPSTVDTRGTVNQNGAATVLGHGDDGAVAGAIKQHAGGRVWGAVKATGRGLLNGLQYVVSHAGEVAQLTNLARSGAGRARPAVGWAGPIVEEVGEGALMIA